MVTTHTDPPALPPLSDNDRQMLAWYLSRLEPQDTERPNIDTAQLDAWANSPAIAASIAAFYEINDRARRANDQRTYIDAQLAVGTELRAASTSTERLRAVNAYIRLSTHRPRADRCATGSPRSCATGWPRLGEATSGSSKSEPRRGVLGASPSSSLSLPPLPPLPRLRADARGNLYAVDEQGQPLDGHSDCGAAFQAAPAARTASASAATVTVPAKATATNPSPFSPNGIQSEPSSSMTQPEGLKESSRSASSSNGFQPKPSHSMTQPEGLKESSRGLSDPPPGGSEHPRYPTPKSPRP